MAAKPFWKSGLRFECQGSGNCCSARGDYGYVYLDDDEAERLAAELGMTRPAFEAEHCATTDGDLHLRDPEEDCHFLTADKRCAVYAARPKQCRTWPFWRENLGQRRVWKRDVVAECPGAGKGKLYSAEEIAALLALHPEEE